MVGNNGSFPLNSTLKSVTCGSSKNFKKHLLPCQNTNKVQMTGTKNFGEEKSIFLDLQPFVSKIAGLRNGLVSKLKKEF